LVAAHIPTGQVGVAEFVGLLINDFAVRPLRRDWREVLQRAQRASKMAGDAED
jgi:hypothetical protein